MTRAPLLLALGAVLFSAASAAPAQKPEKVYRVGFLGARFRSTPTNPDVYYDSWLNGMRDLGYVEGRNLIVESRFAEDHFERLPKLAAELTAIRPDVLVTHALPPTLALQRATTTIPIVFAAMVDPVGNHVVPSLARPGGNTTGLSSMGMDVVPKRVELLKALAPGLSTIAVLVNPDTPAHAAMLASCRESAKAFGTRVMPVEARNAGEIERVFERLAHGAPVGLLVLNDGTFFGLQSLIGRLSVESRLPVMLPYPEGVEAGGLVSYGVSLVDLFRRAAGLVDKILKGSKPGELPIEQPTKIELVINHKTAKALGLTIPPELLLMADKVIE